MGDKINTRWNPGLACGLSVCCLLFFVVVVVVVVVVWWWKLLLAAVHSCLTSLTPASQSGLYIRSWYTGMHTTDRNGRPDGAAGGSKQTSATY